MNYNKMMRNSTSHTNYATTEAHDHLSPLTEPTPSLSSLIKSPEEVQKQIARQEEEEDSSSPVDTSSRGMRLRWRRRTRSSTGEISFPVKKKKLWKKRLPKTEAVFIGSEIRCPHNHKCCEHVENRKNNINQVLKKNKLMCTTCLKSLHETEGSFWSCMMCNFDICCNCVSNKREEEERNTNVEPIEFVDVAGVRIRLCIENNQVVQYRDEKRTNASQFTLNAAGKYRDYQGTGTILGRAKPIWNPKRGFRVNPPARIEIPHCYLCNKKGHHWRECPQLKGKKGGSGKALSQFTRKINEADLKYCVSCFTTGHEQKECPKKHEEKSTLTQRRRDVAKFVHARDKEFNVLYDHSEERKNFVFKKKRKNGGKNEKHNQAKRSASLKTNENKHFNEPPKKKQKLVDYDTSDSESDCSEPLPLPPKKKQKLVDYDTSDSDSDCSEPLPLPPKKKQKLVVYNTSEAANKKKKNASQFTLNAEGKYVDYQRTCKILGDVETLRNQIRQMFKVARNNLEKKNEFTKSMFVHNPKWKFMLPTTLQQLIMSTDKGFTCSRYVASIISSFVVERKISIPTYQYDEEWGRYILKMDKIFFSMEAQMTLSELNSVIDGQMNQNYRRLHTYVVNIENPELIQSGGLNDRREMAEKYFQQLPTDDNNAFVGDVFGWDSAVLVVIRKNREPPRSNLGSMACV